MLKENVGVLDGLVVISSYELSGSFRGNRGRVGNATII